MNDPTHYELPTRLTQRCLDCSLTESCADYNQPTGFQSFSQALVKGPWESWPEADEVISASHLGFVGS